MVEARGGEGDAADGVVVGVNVVCAIGGQYEALRLVEGRPHSRDIMNVPTNAGRSPCARPRG
jgi:hypothetical protein